MKKWILILIIAIFIFCPAKAWASEQYIDTSQLDQILEEIDNQLHTYLDGFSLSNLWQDWQNGELNFNLSLLVQAFCRLFFQQVMQSGALLAQLVGLAMLSVLLSTLKDSFAQSDISQIGRAVIFLLLAAIALNSFSLAMASARDAIAQMSDLIYATLPLLLPLLMALGGISTVAFLQPALLFAISLIMDLMRNFIFPLLYFSAILRIIGHISPKFNIDKIAGLLKDVALGIMTIATTVFIAFLSLSGIASSSFDGLAIKAVKSASGIFIPIVGRSLADALDSVLGTALMLKNVIGLIGALAIILICAWPAITILAQVIIYRLAAAILQPLGEEQLSSVLSGLSQSLLWLFASLALSGLFCFFAIALLIGMGNLTMMMR